jgi:hypothetical protein
MVASEAPRSSEASKRKGYPASARHRHPSGQVTELGRSVSHNGKQIPVSLATREAPKFYQPRALPLAEEVREPL